MSQSHFLHDTHRQDDSLFSLLIDVMAKWRFIAIVMSASIIAGVVYLVITPPVYIAEMQVRPADDPVLAALLDTGVQDTDRGHALLRGLRELQSTEVRRKALAQLGESGNSSKFGSLSVKLAEPERGTVVTRDFTSLTLEGVDPELTAKTLNLMVEIANEAAAAALRAQAEHALDSKIALFEQRIDYVTALGRQATSEQIVRLQEASNLDRLQLQDQIEALRKRNLALRADRIAELQVSLKIAKSLGISDPLVPLGDVPPGTLPAVEFYGDDREFMLGSRILEAQITALEEGSQADVSNPEIRELEAQLYVTEKEREIEALRSRKNEVPFVDDLDTLRSQLFEHKMQRSRDFSGLQVMRVDLPASAPDHVAYPKRLLTLTICAMGGLFLGTGLAALITGYTRFRRAPTLQEQGESCGRSVSWAAGDD